MTDIVERLRSLRYLRIPCVSEDAEEAAAEIERLRSGAAEARETVCPHVRGKTTQHCSLNFTLTDDERAAIQLAAEELDDEYYGTSCKKELAAAATLRSLLERLHSTPQTRTTLS